MKFAIPLRPVLLIVVLCGSRTADADADATALEPVVVTAQRRSQDAQDLGLAVTVVSGEEIAALRLQQPLDLATVAPSLSTMNATSDSTPLFLLRGIGLDDFNTNNSSGVGTYVDDVFASFPGFLTGVMYDLDRVEVLKGPQGTLYGRNTTGGAINLISRKPTSEFEGYLNVDYSRWETEAFAWAVSGPVTDGLRARFAGTATTQGQGYQTDIDTGAKYGQLRRGGARALFDLQLSADSKLLLNLHHAYDHSVPSSPSTPNVEALVAPNLPFATAGLLNSPPGGTLVRTGGLPLYKDESGEGVVAMLEMQFTRATLVSITAFDRFSSHSLDNYDGYPAADNNWTKSFRQNQFSEELRLTSRAGGPVDWIVGASYGRNWYHCADALDWTFVYGLANTITDAGKAITAADFDQAQSSEGVYAHLTLHPTAQWTLVGGLRYSHDTVGFDGTTTDPTGLLTYAANNFSGPLIPGTVLAALDQTRASQDISYRLEADYRLTRKVLLYASEATGYKAGSFYGQPAQVQVDWGYVNPEHVRTTEVGVKSRFYGDALQIDAAAFDTDIRDRQSSLSLWAGPVGTQPLIAGLGNVPRSRIDGVESEVDVRPWNGLRVHLAATYVFARVTETLTSDNGLALYTPVNVGQVLPDAPKFSGSWVVNYEHGAGDDLRLFIQANDHYAGAEHPYLADPTTFGRGHSLGTRLGVKSPSERWEASVWITNLTDNRPLTYAFAGSEGQQVSFYQRPRAVGVSASFYL